MVLQTVPVVPGCPWVPVMPVARVGTNLGLWHRAFSKLASSPAGDVKQVLEQVKGDVEQQKGELVILVGPGQERAPGRALEAPEVLRLLSAELPESRALSLTARLLGVSKKELRRR